MGDREATALRRDAVRIECQGGAVVQKDRLPMEGCRHDAFERHQGRQSSRGEAGHGARLLIAGLAGVMRDECSHRCLIKGELSALSRFALVAHQVACFAVSDRAGQSHSAWKAGQIIRDLRGSAVPVGSF